MTKTLPYDIESLPVAQELMISAKEVCDALGVKRKTLADDAGRIIAYAYLSLAPTSSLDPGIYGTEVDKERFQRFVNQRWDPEDVAYLLELFRAGHLPFRKEKGAMTPEIEAYAATPIEALARRTVELREKEAAEQAAAKAARTTYLSNLAAIPESAFTYTLLNDIFFHHHPKGGEAVLEIGGVKVRKSLVPFRSNSGRLRDWDVRYSWEGMGGKPHEIRKESRFAENRRNDPARNWGLGRE
jgi:hypothetical protein